MKNVDKIGIGMEDLRTNEMMSTDRKYKCPSTWKGVRRELRALRGENYANQMDGPIPFGGIEDE